MVKVMKQICALICALSVFLVAEEASATHFRYGNVTWRLPDPVGDPLTVEFTVTIGWRSAASNALKTVAFFYGDGNSVTLSPTNMGVIGNNTDAGGEDYEIREYVGTHTYGTDGLYTAFFADCCRLSSLQDGAGDQNFRVESVVSLEAGGSNTGGPISGIPVIIQMEVGDVRQFILPVFDPDGDSHVCSFSNQAESGLPNNPPDVNVPGLDPEITFVAPGCTIEWDLSLADGGDVGKKFSVSIEVSSEHNNIDSKTTIDYIIELVPAGTKPSCTGAGAFSAPEGQLFTTSMSATDPNGFDLDIIGFGFPGGSFLSPNAVGDTVTPPFTTDFNWTPGPADAGTTAVVNVIFQNQNNHFDFCTLIVNVPECSMAGQACSDGQGICLANGVIVCQGTNNVCNAVAGPANPLGETCDGQDDDCDGSTDELPTVDEGVACTHPTNSGVCADGLTDCVSPSLECVSIIQPGDNVEICDGLNNDCDTETDEGFNLGAACSVGLGACAANGNLICDPNDSSQSICDATEGTPGVVEICGNAVDEDCDGEINDLDDCPDTDGDGIVDEVEILIGSDPNDADTDDDGVPDGEEPGPGCYDYPACFPDTDGDGLINVLDPDSDNDGLTDGTEMGYDCSDPDTDVSVGNCTPDGDSGSTTTDPLNPDTDNGGVSDGSEDANLNGVVDGSETDPTAGNGGDDSEVINIDTDNDGMSDELEGHIGSDPNDADTDDDGVLDGDEHNPSLDTDGDGLINVLDPDSDNDGLYDGTEVGNDCSHNDTDPGPPAHCREDEDPSSITSALLWDTDGGGVSDGSEDANLNGQVDGAETDPEAGNGADDSEVINIDTDNDGLSDELETFLGLDPNDQDTDDDGVIDGDEPNPSDDADGDGLINTLDVDSDDDGLYDGTELGLTCDNADTDPGPPAHCRPDADGGTTTTNPLLKDTDGGGVPDGSEDAHLNGTVDVGDLDPNDGSDDGNVVDTDNDGLSDELETYLGSDPMDADSDDDGLLDGDERNPSDNADTDWFINLLDVDSDDDGLYDGTENGKDCDDPDTDLGPPVHCTADNDDSSQTCSLCWDTDGGGVSDGSEDSDLDGEVDSSETDPTKGQAADDGDAENLDSDGDGLSDNLENFIGTDPNDLDTDDDGLIDALENNPADDADGDGDANANDKDADGDGLFDGTEKGKDCEHPATDTTVGDCIADADMGETQTNHLDPDTDGGGTPDGEEDENHNGVIEEGEGDPNDPGDDGFECFDNDDCPEPGDVCIQETHICGPGCYVDADCDNGDVCDPGDGMTLGECGPDGTGAGGGAGVGGNGAGGTGSGASGANSVDGPLSAVGGCGCSTPGNANRSAPALIALMGLGAAVVRRRSRRKSSRAKAQDRRRKGTRAA